MKTSDVWKIEVSIVCNARSSKFKVVCYTKDESIEHRRIFVVPQNLAN
jgi:hypothetical protein